MEGRREVKTGRFIGIIYETETPARDHEPSAVTFYQALRSIVVHLQ